MHDNTENTPYKGNFPAVCGKHVHDKPCRCPLKCKLPVKVTCDALVDNSPLTECLPGDGVSESMCLNSEQLMPSTMQQDLDSMDTTVTAHHVGISSPI